MNTNDLTSMSGLPRVTLFVSLAILIVAVVLFVTTQMKQPAATVPSNLPTPKGGRGRDGDAHEDGDDDGGKEEKNKKKKNKTRSQQDEPQQRTYVTDPFVSDSPEYWKPMNVAPVVPFYAPYVYPFPTRDLYNRDPELFCRDPFSPACHSAFWRDWPHSAPPRSRYFKDGHPSDTTPAANITINNSNVMNGNSTQDQKAGAAHSKPVSIVAYLKTAIQHV